MYNKANSSVLQSAVQVRVGDIVCLPSLLILAVRGHNPQVANPHTPADLRSFIQNTLYGVRDLAEIPVLCTSLFVDSPQIPPPPPRANSGIVFTKVPPAILGHTIKRQ
jgi:hypothetical protein